jgi:hypothetical protein
MRPPADDHAVRGRNCQPCLCGGGHAVADYKRPTVYFDRVFTNAEWVVTYEPLTRGDGPTFWVQVGDKTGATTISNCE